MPDPAKLRYLMAELKHELGELAGNKGPGPYGIEIAIVQFISRTARVDGIAGPETKAAIAAWLEERIAERKQGG